MRNVILAFWFWTLLLALSGCGGGGAASPAESKPTTSTSFTVPGSGSANQALGDLLINVASGTFTSDTTITATQFGRSTPSFGSPAAASTTLSVTNSIELSASNQPNREIVLSYPATQKLLVFVKQGDLFVYVPSTISNGRVSFALTADQTVRSRSLGGIVWNIVLGIALGGRDDSGYGLHPLDGSGDISHGTSVIAIHGIMSNWQDMKTVGSTVKQRLGLTNAYSLGWNWALGVKGSGAFEQLATDLKRAPAKSVIIVAHSFGCTGTRYLLQKLGATKAVKAVWLIAGPNEGAVAADASSLVDKMATAWVNSQLTGTLIDTACPAIADMTTNSSLLQELNSSGTEQLGNVDYYLFAGNLIGGLNDTVVSVNSARLDNVNLNALTNGNVYRGIIDGAWHCNILAGRYLDEIISYTQTHPSATGQLSATVESSEVEADPLTGCWYLKLILTNNCSQFITFSDLNLTSYRRDGAFVENDWYDPTVGNGALYDDKYVGWKVNNTLPPGGSVTLNLEGWTDRNKTPVWNQADQLYQASTVAATVRYQADSNNCYTLELPKVVLHYGSIYPQVPQTRKRSAGNDHLHAAFATSRN